MVAASSSAISRLYPATSAWRMAASLRSTGGMGRVYTEVRVHSGGKCGVGGKLGCWNPYAIQWVRSLESGTHSGGGSRGFP